MMGIDIDDEFELSTMESIHQSELQVEFVTVLLVVVVAAASANASVAPLAAPLDSATRDILYVQDSCCSSDLGELYESIS